MYRNRSCNCNKSCDNFPKPFVQEIIEIEEDLLDECKCGFEEEDVFPENYMYGQSYVPIQRMDKIFSPEVGLRMGTIFPELVSTYEPGQSMEEIEYIRRMNKIGKGCN